MQFTGENHHDDKDDVIIKDQKDVVPAGGKVNRLFSVPQPSNSAAPSEHSKIDSKAQLIMETDHLYHGRFFRDELIFRQLFTVRSFEIDFNQKAFLESLMNYSQEVSINRMKASGLMAVGFGVTPEMERRNLVWVFSRMQIVVDCYPSWGDTILANSWLVPAGNNCICCNCLLVDHKTERTLMRASTFGVLLNKQTRKLSKLPDSIKAEMEPHIRSGDHPLVDNGGKLPKVDEEMAIYVQKCITPQWNDLDVNRHVNNVKIISWVLEGTPVTVRESHELSTIILEYRRECLRDNKVRLLSISDCSTSGVLKLDHLLRLENGPEIARIRSLWRIKG